MKYDMTPRETTAHVSMIGTPEIRIIGEQSNGETEFMTASTPQTGQLVGPNRLSQAVVSHVIQFATKPCSAWGNRQDTGWGPGGLSRLELRRRPTTQNGRAPLMPFEDSDNHRFEEATSPPLFMRALVYGRPRRSGLAP
jgi:hypothetical protein